MLKFTSPLAAGALLSLFLCAAPVSAGAIVTFVSGKGTNSGNCQSPASPCRTFQFALGQTSAGGEIKALDPANYEPVTIGKSISITGVEGASIDAGSIDIEAGRNAVVNVSNLTIDGNNQVVVGIVLGAASSFTMTHCVVRNFIGTGANLGSEVESTILLQDVIVSNNVANGILIDPSAGGSVQGNLDHVSMYKSGTGLAVDATAAAVRVTATESTATNNSEFGFVVVSGGILRLYHSLATENGIGIKVDGSSAARSAGNNFIFGNR